MTTLMQALRAPFPPARVSWRVGATNSDKSKGLALAYIDARDVMERLDSVVGMDGWQNRYSHAEGKTICEIGLLVNGTWIWKADGAGDTDTEAEKGALSDAFKRAAVRFGIGRYLYDVESPWVELEARGRFYVIKQSEHKKLTALLSAPSPQEAEPNPGLINKITETLPHITTEIGLTNHWKASGGDIQKLGPDGYSAVKAAFAKRKAELATQEAA